MGRGNLQNRRRAWYVTALAGAAFVTYLASGSGPIERGAPANQAPTVDAGTADTATVDVAYTLAGTCNDSDGPSSVVCTWTKTVGAGSCVFENLGSGAGVCSSDATCDLDVTCDTAEAVTLQLSGYDGEDTTNDTVVITVESAGAVANAGADDAELTNVAITLDCSGSTGASTYAWTLTTQPTGSACTIAAPTSASTTAICSLAGSYVFTCTVDGGADSDTMTATVSADPHPLWASFDRGEFKYVVQALADDLSTSGDTYFDAKSTYGADALPDPPTRPTITEPTPVTCTTAAGCLTALRDDANIGGVVEATSSITGVIACDEACHDKRFVAGSGVDVDAVTLSDASGAAYSLEISGEDGVGAGCIGTIQHSSTGTATDIYIHGISISPECMSTPGDYYGLAIGSATLRLAVAHVVFRAREASAVNGSCGYFGSSFAHDDTTIFNVNCKAAETWSGTDDSWGFRMSGGPWLFSGAQIESWVKPAIRLAYTVHGSVWTPYSLIDGNRHMLLYAPFGANPFTSVGVGSLTDNVDVVALRAKIYMDDQDPSFVSSFWGPGITPTASESEDVAWLMGGNDWTTQDAALMSASVLTTRESGMQAGDDAWYLNALTSSLASINVAEENTHTVSALPAMSTLWTAVVDPDIGTIGTDPDALLPP